MSGFRIYIIAAMTAYQLMEVLGKVMLAPAVSFGAVVGTMPPGTAGRRFATTAARAAASSSSAFAF